MVFDIIHNAKLMPMELLMAICIIITVIVSYLLGSLNFGVIWSKLLYKDDVRSHGSGNAGSTNMLRNYGKKAAVMTLAGDMLKTAVSCLLGYFLGPEYYCMYIAGLACMIGHMFPIFFNFKGGKGIACLAMMVLVTDWRVFLFLLFAFVVLVAGTRYVSLGSVICAMLYPVVLNRMNKTVPFGWLIAFIVAVLIVYMHRENIKRLFAGKENKISFKKKEKAEVVDVSENANDGTAE